MMVVTFGRWRDAHGVMARRWERAVMDQPRASRDRFLYPGRRQEDDG